MKSDILSFDRHFTLARGDVCRTPPPLASLSRPRFWLLLLSLTAAVLLGLLSPLGADPDVPLNWDMSGHLLRAQSLRACLVAGDTQALLRELRAAGPYPPGYHLALGTWLAVAGESRTSLLVFQWLTPLTALLGLTAGCGGLRRGSALALAAGGVVLLSTGQFLALAGSFMLDAPAAALALLALGLLARWVGRPTPGGALAATALLIGTLWCKYNLGLPLLVAVAALAVREIARGRRRQAAVLAGMGLTALAAWAGFLSWQTDGWAGFVEFARNRSNSADWSDGTRAWRYLQLYAEQNFRHPWQPLLLAAMALLGCRRARDPFWLAAAAYVAAAFAAISHHPYFLSRNLLGAALGFCVLAGFGFPVLWEARRHRRPAGRTLATAGLAAAGLLLAVNLQAPRRLQAQMFPAANRGFAPVSAYLDSVMSGAAGCRVFGSFNQFSAPWLQLLWQRSHRGPVGPGCGLDLPFPGARGRSGWDPAPDPQYARRLDDWLRARPEPLLITLEPLTDAVWRDADYRRWNAWKGNYLTAVERRPDLVPLARRRFPEAGLQVGVYGTRPPAVDYLEGWGPAEAWGRWALESRVAIRLPAAAEPRELVLSAAAFVPDQPAQVCTVRGDGHLLGEFRLAGAPWRWQEFALPLPAAPDGGPVLLTLKFSGRWPAAPGDARRRAAPVRLLAVRPAR